MYMSLSKFWELVMEGEAWRAAVHGFAELHITVTELNWGLANFINKMHEYAYMYIF